VEPFVQDGIHKKNIFVDVIGVYNADYLARTNSLFLGNKSGKGIKEVFFEITAGFAGTPRSIYKFNYVTNNITKSPHLTNTLSIDYILDINNDGLDEVLFRGYANGNEIDTIYTKRSDYSSWFTVLDNNLNFLFEPVEINIPFSKIATIPLKFGNQYKLLNLIDSRGNNSEVDMLGLYTIDGKLEQSISIPSGFYTIYSSNKHHEIILNNFDNKTVVRLDNNLQQLQQYEVFNNRFLEKVDLDQDGKLEWINTAIDLKSITIYREDFTHPVSFVIPKSGVELLHYGLLHTKKIKNGIYFQKGNDYFVYRYFKNPWYFFKYLVYLGIYLVIFGLVWLIAKGQNIRNERKKAIEKEIAQLQIKTIKNQVDPHFVFNAINTISEMTLTGDKLAADDFICKFSDLMRKTLQGSDKISHTLQEELDYVENFIQLQQVRFNQSFEYQLNIKKNVNVTTKVPKHVLYCYVENAIKHGLSKIKEKGVLNIMALETEKKLQFIIENNGGGINESEEKSIYGTGNGILIMKKIYDLYYKLYKKKISYKLTEIKHNNGTEIGVRIEISISK
jgi:hypothetical protein